MKIGKIFIISSLVLFGSIGVISFFKKPQKQEQIFESVETISLAPLQLSEVSTPNQTTSQVIVSQEIPGSINSALASTSHPVLQKNTDLVGSPSLDFAEIDLIPRLFALDSTKLPIVETLSYTSRVPWLKGRPAWIADYASHYSTSRHFIARSLNRKPDYFTQKVSPGDRFNVFKLGLNIKFHLLIDLSTCRMWFYYLNLDTNERVLLKTYRVGVGRLDAKSPSGSLTPIGTYHLGDKIAIYKPGIIGFFQDRKIEMIRIFGTRWIPFDQELEGCSQGAQGLGIHGAPWISDVSLGTLVEDRSKIGKYDSDGCVRLAAEDMEELFSIIITKDTTIEIVKNLRDAKLPGVEKKL